MKTAKLGAMFLVAVLALAGIGVGYAAWTDTITIDGTVNTGNVDIDITMVSSTWVYKVLGAGNTGYGLETVVHHDWGSTDPNPPTGQVGVDWWLVASAIATDTSTEETNTITFTYNNLFPCIDFCVDLLWHYDGSIPVKINIADFTVDPTQTDQALIDLWVNGKQADGTGAWIDWYWSDVNGYKGNLIPDPIGIQLHQSNYILVEGHIHLPQDNALMSLNGVFTANVEVVQWNEYPHN